MTGRLSVVLAAVMAAGMVWAAAPPAAADPTRYISTKRTGPTTSEIVVHSAAMNRDIPLQIIAPRDRSRPAPVLYLLNGAGGGEDNANWQAKTDVVKFFADKQAYVVTPMKGAFSYYTDWIKPDPKLGVNKWSTFLGRELPPVINSLYNTNGRNAIAGISTSATSVLNLAIAHPGLYRAVGSYSGCASTTTPNGTFYVQLVVEVRGEGDTRNMWGRVGSAGWRANDPVINAAKLRGLSLYISSATGLPGEFDNLRVVPDPAELANRVVVGGAIEAATRQCTDQLAARLRQLRIPATFDLPGGGSHSWPYWQQQLHRSWPQLYRAIR
ncbi:alpha/beta hydrolase family protein [Gordonia sinesedis]